MSLKSKRKTFFMFFLAFLVASFTVSAIEILRSSFFTAKDLPVANAVPSASDSLQSPFSFADVIEKSKPVVVNISTTKTVRSGGAFRMPFNESSPFDRYFGRDDFFDRFFGDAPPREFQQRSLGSGFIITSDGYIFTNNHVVEKSDKIRVKLSDGREYDAKIIGRDAQTDIALIRIKPTERLPVAEIGDSDKLRVGEWVLAIGNPFGLEQTVTAGIVSAKGRVIGAGPFDNFIQTDASINPGNSGGPLFNMEGKVIGINTAIVAQGQGIGFAVPINMAKGMLADLKGKGKVTRGWIGVSVQDVTDDIAASLKIKNRGGVVVADVIPGDPADKAGLKAGDIILEVNDAKVKTTQELLVLIASFRVGDRVKIKALRDGREQMFTVVVAERKDQMETARANTDQGLGLTVRDITPEIARHFGLKEMKGVIVSDVEPGSSADGAGIQAQDVILQVNRTPVNSLKEYQQEMSKPSAEGTFLLLIKRGRATFFVVIK